MARCIALGVKKKDPCEVILQNDTCKNPADPKKVQKPIGAFMLTYTILGHTYYNYSIVVPKTRKPEL